MRLLLALYIFINIPNGEYHAIYVSVMEMEKRTGTSETRLSIKVFSDDLQNAIRNYSDSYAHGRLETVAADNKKEVEAYFNKHIELSIDGEDILFEFVSSEAENDAHFLNFTFEGPDVWHDLTLKAPYFMEIYPDQSNIIQLDHDGKKVFGRITRSEPMFIAKFPG